ncbi:MAG: TrmH family RNA methyltransferase, partial [Flavobacteriales bacterium]
VYGALLEGENIYTTKILPPAILVLGNEGNGISDEVQQLIDYPIHIPRFGKSESLNVAVAAGILLSEFGRIR